MKKTSKKIKPLKYRKFLMILSLIFAISSVFFIINLCKVDVLELRYSLIIILAIIVISTLLILIYLKNIKFGFKIPFILLGILLSTIQIFGAYNLGQTADFVSKIVNETIKEDVYNIYVLKDSNYASLDELNSKNLGIYDNKSETLDDALKTLKKRITFKSEKNYEDVETLLKDVYQFFDDWNYRRRVS